MNPLSLDEAVDEKDHVREYVTQHTYHLISPLDRHIGEKTRFPFRVEFLKEWGKHYCTT
jgi:hypothetical protein